MVYPFHKLVLPLHGYWFNSSVEAIGELIEVALLLMDIETRI